MQLKARRKDAGVRGDLGGEIRHADEELRPTTSTRRFQTVVSREDITKQTPEKSLVEGKQRTGGRNSTGRVSSRFRGGGHKKAYREIDFKRDKNGSPRQWRPSSTIRIAAARIALLHYVDGEKRYILAPVGPRSRAAR